MSGFLRHLVQRSLTDGAGVRPRPVSRFEPAQPSPATDAPRAALFEMESRSTADDRLRSGRQFTSALDPVSNIATAASARNVQEHPAAETTARPDTWLHPRGDSLRGKSHELPTPERYADSAPTVILAEIGERGHEAGRPAWPATHLVEERSPAPFRKPGRPGARDREAAQAREQPQTPRRLPGESPIEAAAEPSLPESTTASRARHLQVQGKPSAQPDASRAEPRVEAVSPIPERPTALVPACGESPARTLAGEPEPRTVTPPAEPAREGPGDAPSSPAQAILAPRLPQPSIMQPVQPPIAKPAQPIVHVTIGRVEVRAVPAPATPKRAAPTKPTLSLGDYLHRRSGGRG